MTKKPAPPFEVAGGEAAQLLLTASFCERECKVINKDKIFLSLCVRVCVKEEQRKREVKIENLKISGFRGLLSVFN
ncbi:MAG: hypothetical protein CL491_00080 [Acinetobacter sp.]|nr:hypothetical protein [Acinetobacter sp.]